MASLISDFESNRRAPPREQKTNRRTQQTTHRRDHPMSCLALDQPELRYVLLVLGCTSILGCMAVFWGFARTERKPDPLKDPSSIMLFLTVSDVMLAVVSVLDGSNAGCSSNALCVFKAVVSHYFGFASFFWAAAMSHSSYVAVSQLFLPQTADHGKLMKTYHGLCWGIPAGTTVLMLLTSTVAPTGYWCALQVNGSSTAAAAATTSLGGTGAAALNATEFQLAVAVLVYFLPLLLVEFFNLYVFRFLANTLRNLPRSNEMMLRFTRYLVVVIALKAVFLVTRLKSIVAPGNQALWLAAFAVAGPPLQGLGDYLIYSGGREQNRFAQIGGHDGASSTHSAIALTAMRATDDAFMRSSSSRGGGGGDDDDDVDASEGGQLQLRVALPPASSAFFGGSKTDRTSASGRHSLIQPVDDVVERGGGGGGGGDGQQSP